jgi:transposase
VSEYDGRQFVGIDLHRRRTVIVRQSETGEHLKTTRIVNDPLTLAREIGKAGPSPEVVLEATYGWYWAADVLAENGARVHLAHPLGIKGFTYRRVHAILAKQGLHLPVKELFGPRGRAELAAAPLDRAYRARLNAYLRIVDTLDTEIVLADGWIAARLASDAGYRVIQQIPGVGPVWAAVFVAEIGDIGRFASARHLCSWAGLTPRHRESDTTVHRGPITKQGSALVRWAAVEAVQRIPASAGWLVATRAQITERRGRNIATVAVARRLLTLVYYGLRDGHIRALQPRLSVPPDGSTSTGAA